MSWKIACVLAACAATLVAQTPPVTILEIDSENFVIYVDDVNDRSKIATSQATQTYTGAEPRTFRENLSLADIVAVNGKPVKGVWSMSYRTQGAATTWSVGKPLTDFAGGCLAVMTWILLHPDGSLIGTIAAVGNVSGVPAPGAPTSAIGNMLAVVGGTGPFLGVRGQSATVSRAFRVTSMVEDPANRRIRGGGPMRHVLHLIPATWPEVLTVPTGPAIFHGDDFRRSRPRSPPARASGSS